MNKDLLKYELGDLGIGRTLDVAGRILKNRFWDLARICLFFFIPAYLVINLSTFLFFPDASPFVVMQRMFNAMEDPELLTATQNSVAANLVNIIVTIVHTMIVLPITAAAVCRLVAYEYLGRDMKPNASFSWAVKNYFTVLAAYLLFGLILGVGIVGFFVGIMIVAGVAAALKGMAVGGVVLGLGFFVFGTVFLLLYIYLYLRFCLFLPAIVAENCNPVKAIGRSASLTKGRVSRFFWVLSLTWLICIMIGAGAYLLPLGWMTILLAAIASAIAEVFSCTIIVVFYFNCRCKHENTDISLLAESVKAIQKKDDAESSSTIVQTGLSNA